MTHSYNKLCIEDSETQKNFFGDGSNIDCTDKCFSKDIKIDLTNGECIEECGEEEFEFKNICGNECLQGYPFIIDGKKTCLDKVPENYYLDLNDSVYKECFHKCKKCHESGNEVNNNCDLCQDGLIFINDSSLEKRT